MDLIPGVVLFLGAVATIGLLGWDTFQNRKPITKSEMQQSRGARNSSPQNQRRGFFNRG
tara:strand:- start:1612 stop:1788 length:177 start_codon:yes stop_codon:yes gene_type:complete